MQKTNLFDTFLELKRRRGLVYYDVHTNPGDVFSISETDPQASSRSQKDSFPGPSILEKFDYSPLILHVLGFFFRFLPGYMRHEVISRYEGATEKTFLKALDEVGIDKAVALPALSGSDPMSIYNNFTSERFVRLGTVDIQTINLDEIEGTISRQIEDLAIVGLKFNPNIQRFYPEPSRNHPEISRKLKEVYRVASEKELFLLIHGGVSYTPDLKDLKKFEYVTYGELQNFFGTDEKSSYLFQEFNQPIIIAHLGHYNSLDIRYDLLKVIINKFHHVYFDTCGVSTRLIERFIREHGVSHILFGSDMPYFDVKFSVIALLETLHRIYGEEFVTHIAAIFSTNFTGKILR